MIFDPQELAHRYVSVWNEANSERRRELIRSLWPADGAHYVKTRAAFAYQELEERIVGSYEKNVAVSGNIFRVGAEGNVQQLLDVVTFHWEMVRQASNEVLATGLEFLRVDADGKILVDYQFVLG